MIFNHSKLITFLILCCTFLYSNDWESLTSTLNTTDIFIDNSIIYATTNGGIIVIDKNNQKLDVLDFDDSIYPLDLSSIYIDSNNNILLGSSGPIASIQLLNNNYETINTVFLDGMNNITQIDKIIEFNNRIYAIGKGHEKDVLIEFRFNEENNEIYYQDIINNLSPEDISAIYDIDVYVDPDNEENKLVLTTNIGTIGGVTSTTNTINWDSMNSNGDLTHFCNGSVFGSQFNDEEIIDIISSTSNLNELNIITSRSLYKYNIINNDTAKIFESPYEFSDFTNFHIEDDFIALSIRNMGIYTFSIDDNTTIIDKNMYIPKTIIQNKFTAITTTDNNEVFAVTKDGGFILHPNGSIMNFVPYNKKQFYPVHFYINNDLNLLDFTHYNYFNCISSHYKHGSKNPLSAIYSNWNSIYFTNRGITPDLGNIYYSPLVEIDLNGGYSCSNYGIGDDIIDGMNGLLDEVDAGTNYMVVDFLNKDLEGNLWVLNPFSENFNNIIAIQKKDKTWYHLKDEYGLDNSNPNNSLIPTSFDFDSQGRVWISFKNYINDLGYNMSSGGIKILDYNNTIEDLSDDKWLKIENSDIFPGGSNINIWGLVFSKNLEEDILWILTSNGIKGYIVNNLELIEYPQTFYENIYFDQFDKLKVDSQNNVWVITRHSGIRVITQDTSTWPNSEGFTTHNSPILSDIVYDVAFNEDNGKVYFATEKGISILKSPFTQNPENKKSNNEISLSPNPFRIYDSNNLLSIWNLFPKSKVRIMTLNGIVLKTFELNGNENRINNWNGIMDNGNYISSGVYLVTASHPDYKPMVGKLAVIR